MTKEKELSDVFTLNNNKAVLKNKKMIYIIEKLGKLY